MGLKQTISINEFDGKSYQIRLVEGFEEKAVLTHYLHNYRNGVKKHYEKDAISSLKNFVEYKQTEAEIIKSTVRQPPNRNGDEARRVPDLKLVLDRLQLRELRKALWLAKLDSY